MKLRQTSIRNHPALPALKKQFQIKPLKYGGFDIKNKTTEGYLGKIHVGPPGLWLCVDVKGCFDKWSKCPFIINLDEGAEKKLSLVRKCFSRADAYNWSNYYGYYSDPRESLDEFHV